MARRKRPQRAFQRREVGNDVVRSSCPDLGNRGDHRIVGVELASDHSLQSGDNLTGHRHRIERLMRQRGMAAAPGHHDIELISRGHQCA